MRTEKAGASSNNEGVKNSPWMDNDRGFKKRMLGKKRRTAKIDSLIGQNTEIKGDVIFIGGLHVDGKIIGNVLAEDSGSLLTLSDQGVIEGEVRVPSIVLNGEVKGDVYAGERIELAARARVSGNVYYNLIEMAIGAAVNGKLVHRSPDEKPALTHMPKSHAQTEKNTLEGMGDSTAPEKS